MKRVADIVVIGAGPAGLAAAGAAASAGRRVIVVDDNNGPGGQIWRDGPNARRPRRARAACAALKHPNTELLVGAAVVAESGAGHLLLERRDDAVHLQYGTLILCNGARERLLPFPGWTLPGVTGAGGIQALLKAGDSVADQRVVVAGSGPLLLAAAHTVQRSGGRLLRVAEQARLKRLVGFGSALWRWPGKAAQAVCLGTSAYRPASRVVEALGDTRLEAVRIVHDAGHEETLSCERLACGFGLVANTDIADMLGCRIDNGAVAVDGRQTTSRADCLAAGECTGIGGQELSSIEGEIAGRVACGQSGDVLTRLQRRRIYWQRFAAALDATFALRPELRDLATPKTLICRCEDVARADLDAETDAVSAKLVRRCGMGACQGRLCSPATEFLYGWSRGTGRIPIRPARLETLAGIDR